MERQFTKGKCGIKRTPEYYEPKCSRIEIHSNKSAGWICKVQNNGVIQEKEGYSNAKLIQDAFNTANKTGSFPSEILEQRDELLKACINALKDVKKLNKQLIEEGKHGYVLMENELYEAIKKATNEPTHQ